MTAGGSGAVDHDVIVVGCGPVGLTVSHLLGHRGHRVLCLEREAVAALQPRAGHVDAECMRVWQAAGVAEAALRACVPSPGVDMRSAADAILMEFRTPPGPGPQWWARDYAIHQPTFELALREELPANGVELRVGHAVTGIRQDETSVTAETEHGAFSARYLVGCDGGSSFTRKAIGSELVQLAPDDLWIVVDLVLHNAEAELEPGGHLYADPARPHYWRVSAPWLRLEFKVMPGEDVDDLLAESFVLDFVSRWVDPGDIELERVVAYTFHSLLADTWRRGRVLLAGDAAHLQPPFQGQGLCSGIRDAGNLWWKLGRVLDGDADDGLLDTYQSEREPHARAWIVEATAVGAVVQTRDVDLARERDERLLAGDRSGLHPIAPGLGPGIQTDAPPPAGTLSIQPRLDDGTLLDDAAWDRFVVAAAAELVDGLDLGDAFVPSDPTPLLEAHGGQAVVVRPDRYILGVAEARDDLVALLERFPGRLFPAWREEHVLADGFDLRVVVVGEGPPLLALHGAGGLHLGTAQRLIARRRRVYALELPGFGSSPANERSASLDDLAATVLGAADALALPRFELLGTSFGGAVALAVALRSRERVERLVLEAPAVLRGPGWRPPDDIERALFLHAERRPAPLAPDVAQKQLTLVRRVTADVDEVALRELLPALTVPVLVIHGEADGMHPERASRELAALLPDARFELVADAAHEVGVDQPERYAELVVGPWFPGPNGGESSA